MKNVYESLLLWGKLKLSLPVLKANVDPLSEPALAQMLCIFEANSCCVFWSAFGSFMHPKAVQNNFLAIFTSFFLFSDKKEGRKTVEEVCFQQLVKAVNTTELL